MSIEEKFNAGVKVIHSLPKDGPYQPSYTTKLKFYGLYKQACEGVCQKGKPALWNVVGRAKWEAWIRLGNMKKEEAMTEYVDGFKQVVLDLQKNFETMSLSGNEQNFMESLETFYEFIKLHGDEMKGMKDAIEKYKSDPSSVSANPLIVSPENSTTNSESMTSPVTSSTIHEGSQEITNEECLSTSNPEIDTNKLNTASQQQPEEENMKKNLNQSISNDQKHNSNNRENAPFSSNVVSPAANNVHKKLPNGTSTPIEKHHGQDNCKSFDSLQEKRNEEPIPKVGTLKSSTKSETVESGGDSDKYYSGDSDPETDERFDSYNKSMEATHNVSGSSPYQNHYEVSKRNNRQILNGHIRGKAKNENGVSTQALESELVLRDTVNRLNQDMEHVLARLRILEAAYLASADGTMAGKTLATKKGKMRIFGNLSLSSVIFILIWPFAAQFIIKLITYWLKRGYARGNKYKLNILPFK